MVDAPVDECFSLRVRNLPAVLSADAITSLLSHCEATHVRVLNRRSAASSGKEPGAATSKKLQKAVATFPTREAQQNAQRRLHSLELAGHHLQVEVVGDGAATTSTETKREAGEMGVKVPLITQPPLPKGLPPPLPPTLAPIQNPLYAPAPLAPHLGLNYAPSPLLEYKYPKATESIVRNIANALIALPRFYTQVLHLMNKMNLPPPFEEDAIPGRFSKKQDSTQQDNDIKGARKQCLKRRRTDEHYNAQFVEEEEDDDDDGIEDTTNSQDTVDEVHSPPNTSAAGNDSHPDHKPANGSRAELIGKTIIRQNKLASIPKSATFNTAFQLGIDNGGYHKVHQSTRPGVISEDEVNRQRLVPEELMKETLMESYIRGKPSKCVMVKNIARGVDDKDLRFVFGYVLPMDMALDSMEITVLPVTNSARITFCEERMAIAAVDQLHGVQLEGKALIVNFHSTSGSDTPDVAQRWTLQKLASKRLPEVQLASEKVMKRYQRGEPADTLYVKNLAKTVELADLFAVFGGVLPPESRLASLNVRHFTSGRMKCQAFVTYPTVDLASSALLHVHGVVLKDKPLIVCFRKPQTN